MDQPLSVKNHSRFVETYLPRDLERDVKDFTVSTWNVKRWSSLGKGVRYGPVFNCGGYKWRIHLYPFGNSSNAATNDMVSLYLGSHEVSFMPKGWHASAQFALVISNKKDPTTYKIYNSEHRFCAESLDWGFDYFAGLSKLRSIESGHTRPIMQDDTVDITVFVRVLEAAAVTSPSREPTEIKNDKNGAAYYTRLRKKGATSYINTLLQILFSIRSLRKAVYTIPVDEEKPTESTLSALQRIFYRLQASDKCVSTEELTTSLGWGDMDAFFPRDIVDFRRVLLAVMQSTKIDSDIGKLISGEMKTFVKCTDINEEYSAIENFDIIQLEVGGVKTLRNSLTQLIELEHLTGKNKYLDPNHGFQEAESGRIFQSFPPVLFIQLKRWQHDVQRDTMVKINSLLEFPFNIDLDEFLTEDADRSQPWAYSLHAVAVHSGDLTHGHNYALIKPNQDSEWFKFDDDCVTRATEKDVTNTYGKSKNLDDGDDEVASAYVLVYIRDSSYNEVGKLIDIEEIPDHIKGLNTSGKTRVRVEAKTQPEPDNLYQSVKVITDETFCLHDGFDLATFDHEITLEAPSNSILLQLPRNETCSTLKASIASHFKYQVGAQLRLWACIKRENQTFRPFEVIDESDEGLTIESIYQMYKVDGELRLYVEVIPTTTTPNSSALDSESIMLFLKHFDALTQTMRGVGKIRVPNDTLIGDLNPIISTLMQWNTGTSIALYEEVKHGLIDLLEECFTVEESELIDGDIICFQADLTDQEIEDLEKKGFYTDVKQYYDFIQNRIKIIFRPNSGEPDSENPEFTLSLNKNQDYDVMSTRVRTHLGHDDTFKIRFTHEKPNGSHITLDSSSKKSIGEIIGPISDSTVAPVILYEKAGDVNLAGLETEQRNLEITWKGHNSKVSTYLLQAGDITSMVQDLSVQLAAVAPVVAFNDTPNEDSKVQVGEYSDVESIESLPESAELGAMESPEEEVVIDAS